MNEKEITILLVDDQNMYLESVKVALELNPGLKIIGVAKNGLEAFEKINELHPDVLLMDISMPEMDGIDASELILEKYPDQKIILVSTFSNRSYISKSIQIGIAGYVLKDDGLPELMNAIKSAVMNQKYFSRAVSSILAELYRNKIYTEKNLILENLTAIEINVLKDWALGAQVKESADKLSISLSTVEKHRQNIKKKFNLITSSDITLLAVKEGVIRLEDIQDTVLNIETD
jgi:DNA-binding NarL/FixJ family response regulator